jgi:hypothetical protein
MMGTHTGGARGPRWAGRRRPPDGEGVRAEVEEDRSGTLGRRRTG